MVGARGFLEGAGAAGDWITRQPTGPVTLRPRLSSAIVAVCRDTARSLMRELWPACAIEHGYDLQIRRTEIGFRRVQNQIGRHQRRRQHRRDVCNKHLRDGPHGRCQHKHRSQLHSRGVTERETREESLTGMHLRVGRPSECKWEGGRCSGSQRRTSHLVRIGVLWWYGYYAHWSRGDQTKHLPPG